MRVTLCRLARFMYGIVNFCFVVSYRYILKICVTKELKGIILCQKRILYLQMNDYGKSVLRRGWSQQKLADELGIAVVTVNRWERGKQQPTGYYRLKLSTLFEKSAEELGLVEELAEFASSGTSEEPPGSEDEIAREQENQVEETVPSSYETPSEKPLLERETTRRSLSSSYAQFGTPLLKRRGRTLLLLFVLILLVIVAPITFVRIYSTGAKTKIKSTPSPSSAIPFTVPPTWKIALNDPLTATHHNNQWVDDGSQCLFHPDGYYAVSQGTNYCNYGDSSINNFSSIAYSIDILFYKGVMGGLIFRLVDNNYYGFYITTTGKYYILWHTDDDSGNDKYLFIAQPSSAINPGFNHKNTLSILARGQVLQFWINGQMVKALSDPKYKSGTIGVFIGDPTNHSKPTTEALFKNAKVWTPK